MNCKLGLLILTIIAGQHLLRAQTIRVLASGTKTSIRGLSVVDDRIIWVSGSNGIIGRSVDSGNTFKWITVKGYEKTDFRDIEAFDENTAVIMGISAPAYILRTIDGGETWNQVYENKTAGMFLDAMDFYNKRVGIVVGDPINGKFFMASTKDGGVNWNDVPAQLLPRSDSGEACFASSGTNIRKLNKKGFVFVTGGLSSNLIIGTKKIFLPIIQGKESTGANSIAVKDNQTMIVVGGDFNTKDSVTNNCYITIDAGKNWRSPVTPPHGYRSCVEYVGKTSWVSCGLNGVDFSTDEGDNWNWISKEGFHVCRKAKKGSAIFFAGGGGKIGKLAGVDAD